MTREGGSEWTSEEMDLRRLDKGGGREEAQKETRPEEAMEEEVKKER